MTTKGIRLVLKIQYYNVQILIHLFNKITYRGLLVKSKTLLYIYKDTALRHGLFISPLFFFSDYEKSLAQKHFYKHKLVY